MSYFYYGESKNSGRPLVFNQDMQEPIKRKVVRWPFILAFFITCLVMVLAIQRALAQATRI